MNLSLTSSSAFHAAAGVCSYKLVTCATVNPACNMALSQTNIFFVPSFFTKTASACVGVTFVLNLVAAEKTFAKNNPASGFWYHQLPSLKVLPYTDCNTAPTLSR